MDGIYNFIKLDNETVPHINVFLVELDTYVNNKNIINISHKFYKYIIKKKQISEDVLIVISFIKHFSKSIKSLTFLGKNKDTGKIPLELNSLNKIISRFIKFNINNDKFVNYLIYNKNNNINIIDIKLNCSIKDFYSYYN